ncbi:MAG: hypothetical protein ACTSQE_14910 [Candidatus Heimdallarchaeaceae archaeon]
MYELKTMSIISFVFLGMIIGAVIGRGTAPEKIKIVEKDTVESITTEKFLSSIRACNAIAGSMSYQLKVCQDSKITDEKTVCI